MGKPVSLSPPACLIVTGMPGAGKSTVAQLVAAKLARSACLNGDSMASLIVRGGVWALGEPADEAARQVTLCNRNLCSLAANFADAGFVSVIDWIIPNHDQLDFLVDQLKPRPVFLVVLAPSVTACRRRNAARDERERWQFDGYEQLQTTMAEDFGHRGWWFDTSTLTAEDTANEVVAKAYDKAAVKLD